MFVYFVILKEKKTLRLQAINCFFVQRYSTVKHIHWIDFNNFNGLEGCTAQLYQYFSINSISILSGLNIK